MARGGLPIATVISLGALDSDGIEIRDSSGGIERLG
jgi:hypothetical protein